jgi:hypothetical protein
MTFSQSQSFDTAPAITTSRQPAGVDGGFYCKRSEGASDLAHATTNAGTQCRAAEQKVSNNIGYLALERGVVRILQIASGGYVMLYQHHRYQNTYCKQPLPFTIAGGIS